jgi:hypothetical protein
LRKKERKKQTKIEERLNLFGNNKKIPPPPRVAHYTVCTKIYFFDL